MNKQREALEMAQAFIRWTQFGECRTEHHEGPIPTAAQVDAAIREALAEQEQEPVAWAHQPPGMSRIYSIGPISGLHSIPLYTSPPARRSLTDEEIKNALMVDPAPIYRLMTTGCITGAELNEILKRVARSIERAHGIE